MYALLFLKMKCKTAFVLTAATLLLSAESLRLENNKKKRLQRRYKTRLMNRNRDSEGHFGCLVRNMIEKNDIEQYFKYTRMTPERFDELLAIVGPSLQKDEKKGALSPAHKLNMVLK